MKVFNSLNFKSIFTTTTISLMMVVVIITSVGCSNDKEEMQPQYGYVQFKLYKSASYNQTSQARVGKLDLLANAHKVKLVMQYDGSVITQTLVLNAFNNENAEFGLRSDKLQLLAGDYKLIGYYIYDKLDNQISTGSIEADGAFTVVTGGLTVHPLQVDATARGLASFKLIKELSKNGKVAGTAYPFSNIRVIDISVKNLFTQEISTFKKIRVKYQEGFKEGSADANLYPGMNAETSFALCDTTVWLKAGNYEINSYTTYSDKAGKTMLETAILSNSPSFNVQDNAETKNVEVPIRLSETAEYIKDYLALKEIWEALDGKSWKYYGEAAPKGSNWNFNKDIDMWGDQPGIGLGSDGRVEVLNISGFGAKGVVPDAIGQLTELSILALGTHSEKIGGHLLPSNTANLTNAQHQEMRMDYDKKVLAKDVRLGLSDILQDAINRDPSQKPIKKSIVSTKDVQFGNLTNQITGISKALMRLTNLQQLYIANSPITSSGFFRDIQPSSPYYAERNSLKWENLSSLLDIELYNCPKMDRLPVEMMTKLPELQSLNISNNHGISGAQLKSDLEKFIDGNSGDKIQILYMGFNNLIEFPKEESLKKMVKLGLLDCTNNQIEKLHPFGKSVNLVKLYLDNNKIKEIPHAADGFFCGYNDVEIFSCSGNQITVFPNIFNAKSKYVMASVDFSNNQIREFEDGDNFRGVNVANLNLSNNRLVNFPAILFKTGSPINILMLSGNGMKEIPQGSLKGENAYLLSSIDLTFNKLTKLPTDFLANTLPYLYGIDLSYNSFAEFPTEPLNVSTLHVFGIRHQRDDNGNRTLREWPYGLYKCPSLKAFYIGSNDLRKIEDRISPSIFIFEIKDNPNISIDISGVCAYIKAGIYHLIYDKTQDIRSCDYLNLEK